MFDALSTSTRGKNKRAAPGAAPTDAALANSQSEMETNYDQL
jgi:hypothetical protein